MTMRSFIDAVNNGVLSEETLYRGDSSMIDKFDISKTDDRALFKRGIYLTDDPVIASDYTLKGGKNGNVIFAPDEDGESVEARTPKDLVAAYLRHIMYEELDIRGAIEKSIEHLRTEMWGNRMSREDADQQLQAERRRLVQDKMKEAKVLYRERAKTMTMVQTTMGDYRFVAKDRDGYVTAFDVPDDYIARCLHGDAPLPDHVLAAIGKLWQGKDGPARQMDLRAWKPNGDQDMGLTFDEYVKRHKTEGVPYAWRGEDVGGTGENPSLDTLMNGTHHGSSWFYDDANVKAFVAAMNKCGYVGIVYDGGTRVGAHVRGGGGHLHRAYAFWDADAINHFKTGAEKVTDPALEPGIEKGIRLSRKMYQL